MVTSTFRNYHSEDFRDSGSRRIEFWGTPLGGNPVRGEPPGGGIPGTRSTLQHEQDADRRRTVPMGIHSESTPRVLRTEKQDGYPFTTFLGNCIGNHLLPSQ